MMFLDSLGPEKPENVIFFLSIFELSGENTESSTCRSANTRHPPLQVCYWVATQKDFQVGGGGQWERDRDREGGCERVGEKKGR